MNVHIHQGVGSSKLSLPRSPLCAFVACKCMALRDTNVLQKMCAVRFVINRLHALSMGTLLHFSYFLEDSTPSLDWLRRDMFRCAVSSHPWLICPWLPRKVLVHLRAPSRKDTESRVSISPWLMFTLPRTITRRTIGKCPFPIRLWYG